MPRISCVRPFGKLPLFQIISNGRFLIQKDRKNITYYSINSLAIEILSTFEWRFSHIVDVRNIWDSIIVGRPFNIRNSAISQYLYADRNVKRSRCSVRPIPPALYVIHSELLTNSVDPQVYPKTAIHSNVHSLSLRPSRYLRTLSSLSGRLTSEIPRSVNICMPIKKPIPFVI
jgi:hypothetical protein